MTIVTFLGMVNPDQEAKYRINPKLAHALGLDPTRIFHNPNMFAFLLENFPDTKIVAVATPQSYNLQKTLPPRLGIKQDRIHYEILDEIHDYPAIFRQLSDILAKEQEIVVDISHSFRHIPSLMMVDMILENIERPGKIRHILFAKELVPSRKYVIVDLREYLTLANVSYALAGFTKNYTIATTVRTVDELYQALLNELAVFGDHILANSLEALIFPNDGNPSVAKKILSIIEQVKVHETTKDLIHPLVPALDEIAGHMKETLRQADKPRDERYYHFATTMFSKGYLLNALTLVNEAAAAYCVEGFRNMEETKPYIQAFERAIEQGENPNIYNYYELSNILKNIVKLGNRYSKQYRYETNTTIADTMIEHVRDSVNRNYRETQTLRDFLFDCDNTRNNLAHANSAQRLDDVRNKIKNLLIDYENICMFDDPLHRYR